jgi:hypothetical protein
MAKAPLKKIMEQLQMSKVTPMRLLPMPGSIQIGLAS